MLSYIYICTNISGEGSITFVTLKKLKTTALGVVSPCLHLGTVLRMLSRPHHLLEVQFSMSLEHPAVYLMNRETVMSGVIVIG